MQYSISDIAAHVVNLFQAHKLLLKFTLQVLLEFSILLDCCQTLPGEFIIDEYVSSPGTAS